MDNNAQLPRSLWIVSAILGIGATIVGCILIVSPFLFPSFFEPIAVVTVSLGLVLFILGGSVVAVSIGGWRRRTPVRFYSRWGWVALIAISLGLGVLGIALPTEAQSRVVFAPIHVALIVFPGLLVLSLLSLVVGRDRAMLCQRMVLTVAGGAASVLPAVPVELVGLLLSSLVGVLFTLLLPGGPADIEELTALLQQWMQMPPTDEAEILAVIVSPLVLVTLGLTLAVVAPLVEEFCKTLVMGVLGMWVRPSLLTSFLWGAACGLGFAWFEGVSNGALGLGEAAGWVGSVVARFFATAMHALTSGIVGLGWAWFWRRRRGRLVLCYAIAVVFHGLWNLNVILGLVGMGRALSPGLGTAVVVLAGVVQAGLVLAALGALFAIPWVLRRQQRT